MLKAEGCNSPLPAEQLPGCWINDERMKSLFAPFRNRNVNPEDWNSKFKFWHNLINTWSIYYLQCSFTLADLKIIFKRNNCTALCLSAVLDELCRIGEIMPLSDFLEEPSNTWSSWTIDLLFKKPIYWIFSKYKRYMSQPQCDSSDKYIHIGTLKYLGEMILSVVDNKHNSLLLSLSELKNYCVEKCNNKNITESNLRLALIWLKRINKIAFKNVIKNNECDLLIKITANGTKEITAVDEGIYRLLEQENILIKHIEKLEKDKNDVIYKAKSSLQNGSKQLAKNFLRQKHDFDKCIEKQIAVLQNIQRLLSKIQDARYDINTLAAYKAGYNALKVFEDVDLTEDNVKDTMDDIFEILAKLNDVQSTLVEPVSISEEDFDIEKELNEMMDDNLKIPSNSESFNSDLFDSVNIPDLRALNLKETMRVHQWKWSRCEPQKINFNEVSCYECNLNRQCEHYQLGSISYENKTQKKSKIVT